MEIFTLTLPVIMCLKCFWLKVEHLDISESSSDWAEQRFQIEIWAKSEAGGAYIKKRVSVKVCTYFVEFYYHVCGIISCHVFC